MNKKKINKQDIYKNAIGRRVTNHTGEERDGQSALIVACQKKGFQIRYFDGYMEEIPYPGSRMRKAGYNFWECDPYYNKAAEAAFNRRFQL